MERRRFAGGLMDLMGCQKRWTLKVTVLHGLASLLWLYGHLDSTCWRMGWVGLEDKQKPGEGFFGKTKAMLEVKAGES